MSSIIVSKDKLDKVLIDVEVLINDVSTLLDVDEIARKRLLEIKSDPLSGLEEDELDSYLEKRGVKID